MKNYPNKKNTVALFVLLSLLSHLAIIFALLRSGPLFFNAPVQPHTPLSISIASSKPVTTIKGEKSETVAAAPQSHQATQTASTETTPQPALPAENPTQPEEYILANKTTELPPLTKIQQHTSETVGKETGITTPEKVSTENHSSGNTPLTFDYEQFKGPVRESGEFLSSKREKLTYRISLLKIPVGTAVMEATNSNGELRITITITSNSVFSKIYPVDDLVETRMIKGNYLLTRVRQSEGNFKGDFGFTLMLRERKAFWVDRLTNRFNYQPLPVDNVMDAVSGFYFLRNRTLEVGNPVQLHLFDSNEYSLTTVEVLRKETIELSDGRKVEALVLHPRLKTAGFFRRTGDIMLWLTDDTYRVPVRLETSIMLGKITAELISVESEQDEGIKERESVVRLKKKSDH